MGYDQIDPPCPLQQVGDKLCVCMEPQGEKAMLLFVKIYHSQ